MILILTEAGDQTADLVAEKLHRRGARFLRFDNASFPKEARISFHYLSRGRVSRWLDQAGEGWNLDDISVAWDRRPQRATPHDEISRDLTRQFIERESEHFLDDLWHSLDCEWLPAPRSVIVRGQHKLSQLRLADALGFELPPTLVSNDPARVRDFFLRHGGRIISKVFYKPSLLPEDTPGEPFAWRRLTEVVSNRSLGYLSSVRFCPSIFQVYVPKRLELRVTVVGDQVFAAEIHSQANSRTRHDWRRNDLAHTPYHRHDLPETERRRCLALVERMGLSFGAIDLILTPDGRYVFLEINPAGQWRWVESMTGLPISEAICDHLLARERARAGHEGEASWTA